jgi:hypothetical protein
VIIKSIRYDIHGPLRAEKPAIAFLKPSIEKLVGLSKRGFLPIFPFE